MKKSPKNEPEKTESEIGYVKVREITDEMQESYIDYAMSVIVSRALPDVRDGLKPVHRRILYAMYEDGLKHTAKFRKSANVIGSVLGRYHPHGDMSVYDAMVRMAQDFSFRYPLVDGQGNFGSIDGDSPAAYRYCVAGETLVITEHGLQRIDQIANPKNARESEIDVKILSKDKEINKASKWFDSGIHPTLSVTTQKGYSIKGSYNHPVLTFQYEISGRPFFQWKTLEQLCEEDVMVLDRSKDVLWPKDEINVEKYYPVQLHYRTKKRQLPLTLNEGLASLLGAFLSEGTIQKKKIEFCNTDRKWIFEIQKKWEKVFPDSTLHRFERKPSSYGKKPYSKVECHTLHTLEFLKNIGLPVAKSKERVIPDLILRSPKHIVSAFLRAYFEGDGGTIRGEKRFDLFCSSTSRQFLKTLQILLLRYGIGSSVRYDKNRKLYTLFIRGAADLQAFTDEIGFFSERKSKKILEYLRQARKDFSKSDFIPYISNYIRNSFPEDANFLTRYNFDRYRYLEKNFPRITEILEREQKNDDIALLDSFIENHYLFEKIAKIEKCNPEKVYSIKMESACHSFVGNGFINHNTESRMSYIGEELLKDIEKGTVDFTDNYDGTQREPVVLPSPFPQLLLNGTLGIAVGMATSIPPHNLSEVIDAACHIMHNPDAKTEDLFKFIKGPDFPTGGQIYNQKEIITAYSQGKGPIVIRGKAEVVDSGKIRQIAITEIPYQVNKATLIEQFAKLVIDKKIDGIKDIRDESDREGMRIAIDLKAEAHPKKIINRLYKFSNLQKTFHLNMIALVDGIQPRTLSLAEVLSFYIDHRKDVVYKRTKFELDKAKERAHILEGLVTALVNIDKCIKIIKESKSKDDARQNLMKSFKLTDIQANAILEIRLHQLAKMERDRIEEELKNKLKEIKELTAILKSPKKIEDLVEKELIECKEIFGDDRRTKVYVQKLEEIAEEDLIPLESTIITITSGGYIKRINPQTYKIQKRGGRGILGMKTVQEDVVEHFIEAKTHDSLLFFTDSGKVFRVPAYEIPEATRVARGRGIFNFLEISSQEKVLSVIPLNKEDTDNGIKYLVMATEQGVIKKTPLDEFKNIRRSGLIAINLRKGDLLKNVCKTTGKDDIVMVTRKGQSIRFKEKDIREMGRTASGIRGIRLKKTDKLVGMDVIKNDKEREEFLLVVTENGFGKKTVLKEYRTQQRGGSGIKALNVTDKTGNLAVSKVLFGDEDDLIVISRKGHVIKSKISLIPRLSRTTQGVRLMRLGAQDKVASAICT